MRIVAAALFAPLLLLTGTPVSALENTPIETLGSGKAEPSRTETLDTLFNTLKSADDESEATKAENAIIRLWMDSGSDTIDLLMSWAQEAIDDKDYGTALDFLDRVVTMKPDFAEGWNRRATVYYLTDKYGHSISDLARVLALEPRHFGALTGLGSIFREIGDDKRAIAAYGEALALDPHLAKVKEALDELQGDSGDDI